MAANTKKRRAGKATETGIEVDDVSSVPGGRIDGDSDDAAAGEETERRIGLILDACVDESIPVLKGEAGKGVWWNDFLEELKNLGPRKRQRELLETKFRREVVVYKDADRTTLHRRYTIDDTVLERALRRNPPANVLKRMAAISPAYRYSKVLYDIVANTERDDDEWTSVKELLQRVRSAKSVLTADEQKNVLLIRHGWREETLLMITSRRDPPASVVKRMLKMAPEAISIVDTPLYDWIPLRYSFCYPATPEVTEALIPKREHRQYFTSMDETELKKFAMGARGEVDFLTCGIDVYDRTALHWTVVYDSPLKTVEAIVRAAGDGADVARSVRDGKGDRPFELAVKDGADVDIIRALLPEHLDFEMVLQNIVKLVVMPKRKRLIWREDHGVSADGKIGEGGGAPQDRDVFDDELKTSTSRTEPPTPEDSAHVRFARHDSTYDDDDDDEELRTNHISSKIYPYLAKKIAQKRSLQRILIQKSCETLPTAIMMMDFYTSALLIVSFRQSLAYYLQENLDPSRPLWPPPTDWFYIMTGTVGYMLLWEVVQFVSTGFYYLTSIWNFLDVSTVALVCVSISCMVWYDVRDHGPLIVATTAFVWLHAILFLRSTFLPFAVFVSGVLQIIVDLLPFLIVSGMLLIAFGEMYWADSWSAGQCDISADATGDAGGFCTYKDSLLTVYAFFVEGIDILAYSETKGMTRISALFGFVVVVVLLSVVIAIVSDAWSGVTRIGEQVYWNHRLKFYHEVRCNEDKFFLKRNGDEKVMGRLLTAAENVAKRLDRSLDRICCKFWVREYWGHFDSIVDRMVSKEYGGFRWQFRYDWKQAGSLPNSGRARMRIAAKTFVLLLIFGTVASIWFAFGLVTAGVFWPKSMRRWIFGRTILADEHAGMERLTEKVTSIQEEVRNLTGSIYDSDAVMRVADL